MKSFVLRNAVGLLLIATTAVMLIAIIAYATRTPPIFDGAMNLQGAWSLAQGDGFRRSYGEQDPFPHSIQTNLPFALPAALVFKLFGLGIWQSQLANLLFLTGLVAAGMTLLHRRFGLLPAGLAGVLLCATPGLLANGLGGYGEIPALCLAVLALLVFPFTEGRHVRWRVFLAGALLSLAVATKVVLAICAGTFGFVFVCFVLFSPAQGRWDSRWMRIAFLGAGCLLPLLLAEGWKLASLGGFSGYYSWWLEETGSISMQAGVSGSFQDIADPFSKLARHLEILGGYYALPRAALLAWLLLPYMLCVPLFLPRSQWRLQGPFVALLLATAAYFIWWLLVTPTLKTYHRRIIDGSLLLNLSWAWLAGAYLSRVSMRLWEKAIGIGSAIVCLGLAIVFYRADLSHSIRKGVNRDNFMDAVSLLRKLPSDAKIFGVGWYSAPALSLLAERPLLDFNDTPIAELDRTKPIYFALDTPALGIGAIDRIEETYVTRPLLPEPATEQVYEVRLDQLHDKVAPANESLLAVTANLNTAEYPFVRGYQFPSSETRWMSSDGYVMLRYNGSPTVFARVYIPDLKRYLKTDHLRLSVAVNGCELGDVVLKQSGISEIEQPIPERCRPATGRPATVRMTSDNLVRSGIILDDRALSVVVNWIGFERPSP